MGLLSWFRRKVTVEPFTTPVAEHTHIRIDAADGSEPCDMVVTKNNLFTLAYVIRGQQASLKTENGGKPWREMSLTLNTPEGVDDVWTQKLVIPDWAQKKLFKGIQDRAMALGWKGEYFQPERSLAPTAWKRLDEDVF